MSGFKNIFFYFSFENQSNYDIFAYLGHRLQGTAPLAGSLAAGAARVRGRQGCQEGRVLPETRGVNPGVSISVGAQREDKVKPD
jgi:hypothetical protein